MTLLVNMNEEKIESTKGIKIFVRSWNPPLAPKAVVVICHGVNSHGGQYTWVGEQFASSTVQTLTWTADGVSTVRLEFSPDNGVTWRHAIPAPRS